MPASQGSCANRNHGCRVPLRHRGPPKCHWRRPHRQSSTRGPRSPTLGHRSPTLYAGRTSRATSRNEHGGCEPAARRGPARGERVLVGDISLHVDATLARGADRCVGGPAEARPRTMARVAMPCERSWQGEADRASFCATWAYALKTKLNQVSCLLFICCRAKFAKARL